MDGELDDVEREGLDWLDPILDYWPDGELALNCAWEGGHPSEVMGNGSGESVGHVVDLSHRESPFQTAHPSSDVNLHQVGCKVNPES